MRLEDAPTPGWYPDPEGRRLRWWDGTDWSDTCRPVASDAETLVAEAEAAEEVAERKSQGGAQFVASRDNRELVAEAQAAAREEVTRAADLFSRRARMAVDRAQAVAAEYMSLVFRWIRIILVVGALLVIAWVILQLFVQAAFLDWIGDRIDNLTG